MLRRIIFAPRQHPHLRVSHSAPSPPSIFLSFASERCFAQALPRPKPPVPSSAPTGTRSARTSINPHPRVSANDPALSKLTEILSHQWSDDLTLTAIRTTSTLVDSLTNNLKLLSMVEGTSQSAFPHHAYRILVLAHRLGHTMKPNTFECVCYHLSRRQQWASILSIVRLATNCLPRTTTRLLNWRTRALMETANYAELYNITAEFARARLRPSRKTFHLLLASHLRNCDLSRARVCLQLMEEGGYPIDASTHATIASNYRSLGLDLHIHARALEALPHLPDHTATSLLNHLIQNRLRFHDLTTASQLLSLFHPRAIDLIQSLISSGDKLYVREGTPQDELSSKPWPDAKTFSIFINYMSHERNLEGAMNLIQAMLALNIKHTVGTITSLVNVYFATKQPQMAVRLVAAMCATHPSQRSLHALASTIPESPLPLNVAGIKPTTHLFNTLLRGLLRFHGLNSVHIVLRAMKSHGISPDESTLEVVLRHLVDVERAGPSTLLYMARQLFYRSVHPTPRHIHLILASALRREKYLLYGRGRKNISHQTAPRVPISDARLSQVKDSLDPVGGIQLPKALRYRTLSEPIIDLLTARGHRADGAAFALRLNHSANASIDRDVTRDVFDSLLARGIHPNHYHFSAVLDSFVLSGDFEAAKGVMRSAAQLGVKPNVVMYTMLIVGYGRRGKPDQALRVFQQMVDEGVTPDVAAIDAVTSAFFAVGAYRLARTVLITLWSHISPFPKALSLAPLKELVTQFRLLDERNHHPLKISKSQRRLLHWKLRDVVTKWKQIEKPLPVVRNRGRKRA